MFALLLQTERNLQGKYRTEKRKIPENGLNKEDMSTWNSTNRNLSNLGRSDVLNWRVYLESGRKSPFF